MLKTRHREALLLRCCLAMQQRFVVDNTNPTIAERARYIAPARAAGFRVVGYYFRAEARDCVGRNARRPARERVPPQRHARRRRRVLMSASGGTRVRRPERERGCGGTGAAQAIYGTRKRLQPPTLAEGFDALYVVRLAPAGAFAVGDWSGQDPRRNRCREPPRVRGKSGMAMNSGRGRDGVGEPDQLVAGVEAHAGLVRRAGGDFEDDGRRRLARGDLPRRLPVGREVGVLPPHRPQPAGPDRRDGAPGRAMEEGRRRRGRDFAQALRQRMPVERADAPVAQLEPALVGAGDQFGQIALGQPPPRGSLPAQGLQQIRHRRPAFFVELQFVHPGGVTQRVGHALAELHPLPVHRRHPAPPDLGSQLTTRNSREVLVRNSPPSAVQMTQSSMRTPKRPGR